MTVQRWLLVVLVAITACSGGNEGDPPGLETATPDSQSSGSEATPTDPAPTDRRRPAVVDFVQDGDSMVVTINGAEERVRLIGVNTPERGECYGDEARVVLQGLVEDETVDLVVDVEERDRFGRILAYVYRDNVMINAEIVRRGAALARPFEPNITHQAHLEDMETLAKREGIGMWSPDTCGGRDDSPVAVAEIRADPPGRDEHNLNGEWVVVVNRTGAPVDLTGWSLRDESSVHRYRFPVGSVVDDQVTVFTGCGPDQPSTYHWCAETPVWDNAGDTAFLSDADGVVVHRFEYRP